MKNVSVYLVSGLLLSTLAVPVLAGKNLAPVNFFDTAICQPSNPFSGSENRRIYEAAENLGEPDKLSAGSIHVHHLPVPIKRHGFVAQDVVFFSSTIGVLIEGDVVEKLAKQYALVPEKLNIINMSGYSRKLPDAQQTIKELGLFSIVALKGGAFKNKTLLACQFVSNEDRKNLEWLSNN